MILDNYKIITRNKVSEEIFFKYAKIVKTTEEKRDCNGPVYTIGEAKPFMYRLENILDENDVTNQFFFYSLWDMSMDYDIPINKLKKLKNK